MDCHGILGSPPGLGLRPTLLLQGWLSCSALPGGDQVLHYGDETASFGLISMDSDAGLALEVDRPFCWVLTALIVVVFTLKYTLCLNYWLFCLLSKLTLQNWKLPHFYFNLKHPAEYLTQREFQ